MISTIDIDENSVMTEDEEILICAFRYCLGRMTYIVKECDGWIRRRWPTLGSNAKILIDRDLAEAIMRADRNPGFTVLGADMDERVWRNLYDWIRNNP